MPPPNQHTGSRAGGQRGQHAHVHVHRRHVRVARMEHQRDAHRLERRAGQLGPVLRGRGRQRGPRRARSRSRRARTARRLRSGARCRRPAACSPGSRCQASATNGVAVLGLERGDDALPAGRAGSRGRRRGSSSGAWRQRLIARWPMSLRYCAPSKRMPRSDLVGALLRQLAPSRRARSRTARGRRW